MIASIALLVLPSAAFASSSTCQSYNPQLCGVQNKTASTGTTPTAATKASTGSLPFTGLDVVLLAAGGGALLGAGLVVRRLSSE
ncbi:MAG: hypothetical protein JOZ07_16635 [Solirubrobacterales bacterium]|nr:hypothetical protein [Solirubrobacterales bacterium]